MKILQINKFYFINGGTARYFFEVSNLFKKYKHKIACFSMYDPKNYKTKWSKFFVSNISYEKVSVYDSIKKFMHMIYSIEARDKISQLLDNFKPDVVHLHSIYHHLSPSVILELKKRNIPIIQTVHDYHLISPCRGLFHDGKICEISKPNNYYKTILHRCIRQSIFASFAEAFEKYVHLLLGWDRKYIDYFIAPSRFMKNKLIDYGINSEKVIFLPYFINIDKYTPGYRSCDYILFFGRLSPEKGLNFLLDVMDKLPHIKLLIVGRGQEELSLKAKKTKLKLENVEFLGFKDGFQLRKIIQNSRFTVLPSVWYDVAPISILESFASSKPMIASKIGGIPEFIQDNFNGFVFEPGNIDDLVEKINKLWNNPTLCRKMGENARKYVEKNFGPEEHYEKLMAIYKKAIAKHREHE